MKKTSEPIALRTVFMGTSFFANTILEKLLAEKYNILGVYTKPDKKTGRKQTLKPGIVKETAQKNSLRTFQPQRFDKETIAELSSLRPDIIIVASYGKILPKAVLDMPGFGCINVHASLLPELRGPSPIQNALLQGKTETGVTIMLMDEGIDTGAILSQEKIAIDKDDSSGTLFPKIADLGAELLAKTLPAWINRQIEPAQQEKEKATLCQLIEREDGHIFWSHKAAEIHNRYRALTPWPGIFSFWRMDGELLRLKLLKISLQKTDPLTRHEIGQVFELGDKIAVQAMEGAIVLETVQLEGKNPVSAKDFTNGYKDFIGSILS